MDTAADGAESLLKARGHDDDAIQLDAMLPGLDGWAVLALAAEDEGHASADAHRARDKRGSRARLGQRRGRLRRQAL